MPINVDKTEQNRTDFSDFVRLEQPLNPLNGVDLHLLTCHSRPQDLMYQTDD
jgi:hypothetical protein